MANLWNSPDTPHKEWRCVDVIDVCLEDGDEYETCEMCGKHPIRFVHIMEHCEQKNLRVGCKCAQHMTDDYVHPQAREKQLRNKAARRRNWLKLKWKHSRKGNPYLQKDGMNLGVFERAHQPGSWNFRIDEDFSNRPYPSENAAKMALFEEYWSRTVRGADH